jgi:hypothetical protein
MRFHSNQEIICIDDTPFDGRQFNIRKGALKKGSVYSVRDYVPQSDWVKPLYCDEPCIRLNEIVRWQDKIGFRESRFSPIKKTSKKLKKKLLESV